VVTVTVSEIWGAFPGGIDNFKPAGKSTTPMALEQSLERSGKEFLQVHPLAGDGQRWSLGPGPPHNGNVADGLGMMPLRPGEFLVPSGA
jgi:hypothetical protein